MGQTISWVKTRSTRADHTTSAADNGNAADPGRRSDVVMCASDAPHGWEDITPPVTLAHSPVIKVAGRLIGGSFVHSLARVMIVCTGYSMVKHSQMNESKRNGTKTETSD